MENNILVKTKTCLICKEEKLIDDFYYSRGYPQGYCKICQNEFAKKWRYRNADKIKEYRKEKYKLVTPEIRRRAKLVLRYKITLEEYDRILNLQKGVCAICKMICRTHKYLSIDHCHNTGVVRGLLCNDCNNVLGRARDSSELLRNAANYLDKSWTAK